MAQGDRLLRITLYRIAVLGTGLYAGACIANVHDAFVAGSKNYFAALFSPSNLEGFPFDSYFTSGEEDGDGT